MMNTHHSHAASHYQRAERNGWPTPQRVIDLVDNLERRLGRVDDDYDNVYSRHVGNVLDTALGIEYPTLQATGVLSSTRIRTPFAQSVRDRLISGRETPAETTNGCSPIRFLATSGYYGLHGRFFIEAWLRNRFWHYSSFPVFDGLDYWLFFTFVLLPEVASLLVSEDLRIDLESARRVVYMSSVYGYAIMKFESQYYRSRT